MIARAPARGGQERQSRRNSSEQAEIGVIWGGKARNVSRLSKLERAKSLQKSHRLIFDFQPPEL